VFFDCRDTFFVVPVQCVTAVSVTLLRTALFTDILLAFFTAYVIF